MGWHRGLFGLAAVLLAGCSVPRTVELTAELPEDATWLALLTFGEGDVLLASTGLLQRTPGEPSFAWPQPDSEAWAYELFAFSAATLDAVAAPSDAQVLFDARVELGDFEHATLPAPSWSSRYVLEDGAPSPQGRAPDRPLVTGWLAPCRTLDWLTAVESVDVSCAIEPCAGHLLQQGCRLDIDLAECLLGTVGLEVRGSLPVAPESSDLGDCRVVPSEATDYLLALECRRSEEDTCTIEVHGAQGPPRFSVAKKQVLDVLPIESAGAPRGLEWVSGMVVRQDRVWLGLHADAPRDWQSCMGPEPDARFVAVDLESLEIVATATAPSCVSAMAADPMSPDRFLAVYGAGDRIGRFDRDGRLLLEQPLSHADLTPALRVPDLRSSPDPMRLISIHTELMPVPIPGRPSAQIGRLDPNSLRLLQVVDVPSPSPPAFAGLLTLSAERLIVEEEDRETLVELDPDLLTVKRKIELGPTCRLTTGVAAHALAFSSFAGEDRLLLAASDEDAPSLLSISDPEATSCLWANWYLHQSESYGIARLGAGYEYVVTLMERASPERASLALYSAASQRFVPGELEISVGPSGPMDTDEQGRVWIAYPNSAVVARVSKP